MQDLLRGHLRRRCAYGLLAFVAVVLAAGCAGSGDGPETARSRDNSGCRTSTRVTAFAKEIDSARPLALRMKRGFGAPGLAIAVAVDGQVVWSEVCGYADLSRRMPVTAATRFRIGSVSKTLTAAAAARLVQEERLDLDAPIQRYVASFPAKGHPVTARDLLAHVAGIRHYQGNEALSGVHYVSVTDALRVFARDPLLFEPGTQYSYSSYGFNLVGAAIEAIGEETLRRRCQTAGARTARREADRGRRRAAARGLGGAVRGDGSAKGDSGTLGRPQQPAAFRRLSLDCRGPGAVRLTARRPHVPPQADARHLLQPSSTSPMAAARLRAWVRGRGGAVRPRRRPHRQCRRGHGIPARATSCRCGNCDGHEHWLRNRATAPDLSAVPDPPALFAPFVTRALRRP